ncbi:MAG: hypothetical protein WCW53_15415 [Syntrophales bacterium]|jgi:hypothetical protein
MSKPSTAMKLLEKHFDTAFAAPDSHREVRCLADTPEIPSRRQRFRFFRSRDARDRDIVNETRGSPDDLFETSIISRIVGATSCLT